MPLVARRLITVEQYHRMGEVGILAPDERVELINGELIQMSPIGSRHAMAVARWTHTLVRMLGDSAIVWVQNPVVADPYSELQPDLAVLRSRPGSEQYWGALPEPEDTLLVVEVSDSSLAFDHRVKVRLYARSGIPQVVITDLVHNRVESYTDPADGRYTNVQTLGPTDTLTLVAFSGRTIALADILPPAA